MSAPILVPTLGESVTEATVAKWLKLHDVLLREYGAKPIYKAREVMNDKHANSRN